MLISPVHSVSRIRCYVSCSKTPKNRRECVRDKVRQSTTVRHVQQRQINYVTKELKRC